MVLIVLFTSKPLAQNSTLMCYLYNLLLIGLNNQILCTDIVHMLPGYSVYFNVLKQRIKNCLYYENYTALKYIISIKKQQYTVSNV